VRAEDTMHADEARVKRTPGSFFSCRIAAPEFPVSISRRRFVTSTTAGVVSAGAALRAKTVRQPAGQAVPPNDRVVVALVGCGGMGKSNLRNFLRMREVHVAAVCDVWEHNRVTAAQIAGTHVQQFADFRRVIDMNDVDAVIVATPDHWHAIPAIAALDAGKDVYVEKPLAHNIYEGRKIVEAARRNARIVQVGTQQRSGEHFKEAVQLVRDGKIGKVGRVHCWNHGNVSPAGIGNPPDSAPPAGLDWDMYLGPAPKVPFNPNRFTWHFRWYWDYAGGMMTDWGVHLIDIVQWAMDVHAPLVVSASGGRFYLADNRETPDTILAVYEYPGFVMTYENRSGNAYAPDGRGYGILFYGSDATLFLDRAGYELIPETAGQHSDPTPVFISEMKEVEAPLQPWERPRRMREGRAVYARGEGSEQNLAHTRNFIDCLKSRSRPNSDVEIGHASTTAAHLGNVAFRSDRKIRWDAKKEQVIGDAEANAFVSREYRSPWKM
jgi:predicted dehydrogenase